jgi:hypothetical protein
VSPVKYELGFFIPEDDILRILRRVNLKLYIGFFEFVVWPQEELIAIVSI